MLLFLWHILVIVLHSQRWLSYGLLIIKPYNNIRHTIQSITINVLIANIYQFPVILISIISNRTSCLRAIMGFFYEQTCVTLRLQGQGMKRGRGSLEAPQSYSLIIASHYGKCDRSPLWLCASCSWALLLCAEWLAACGGQGGKIMMVVTVMSTC